MSHAVQALIPGIGHTPFVDDEPAWLSALRIREAAAWDKLRMLAAQPRHHLSDRATYVQSDVLSWLAGLPPNCFHAVVTDPPYGMVEYDEKNHAKLRKGRGGVWRIPPSFDGAKRKPLPRFTVLSKEEVRNENLCGGSHTQRFPAQSKGRPRNQNRNFGP